MLTAKEFVTDFEKNHMDTFIYLYERWQDEKEYEDFEEYVQAMRKSIPALVDMTATPFAFLAPCAEGIMRVSATPKGSEIEIALEVLTVQKPKPHEKNRKTGEGYGKLQ